MPKDQSNLIMASVVFCSLSTTSQQRLQRDNPCLSYSYYSEHITEALNFKNTYVHCSTDCLCVVELVRNLAAHGDAREGKWRGNRRMEWVASTLTPPPNVVYPALLPLMRAPRLPAVDWTDAPADLNGLVRFGERRNLVSARVPSGSTRALIHAWHGPLVLGTNVEDKFWLFPALYAEEFILYFSCMFLPQCCIIETQFLFNVGYDFMEMRSFKLPPDAKQLSSWENLVKTEQQTQLIVPGKHAFAGSYKKTTPLLCVNL